MGVDARFFYRLSPAAGCDAFCSPPFPRAQPVDAAALVRAVMANDQAHPMYFSHQYAYWVNDCARAAFEAHGHGIIDVEAMLGVRADAHPASSDGRGDRLHFCQPGPADWALDVIVRRVATDMVAAAG